MKTKATKNVAKKTTPKAEPTTNPDLNLWKLACDIESSSMKIEQVKEIVELVTESSFAFHAPIMLWLASDLLAHEMQTLNKLSNEVMELHRQQHQIKK